jgi:hypothetical protein
MRRTRASAGGRRSAFRGISICRFAGAKYGKLQSVAPARALWAFDLLARRHHDTLVARLAVFANILVNWHFPLFRTKAYKQCQKLLYRASRSSGIGSPSLRSTFKVTEYGVPGHLPGFRKSSPIGNQAGKEWNGYLVSLRGRIPANEHFPAISPHGLSFRQWLENNCKTVIAGRDFLRSSFADTRSRHRSKFILAPFSGQF